MYKQLATTLIAAGVIGLSVSAFADVMTKDQYKAERDRIAIEYKGDRENCLSMSGNAKDVCVAEAKGRRDVGQADAEAAYKATDKDRLNARLARADATYAIDKEKCDDQSGNAKAVCKKDAKANYVRAKTDAKAGKEIRDIRRDAAADQRSADYAAARQRCDALAGDAKTQCQNNAKAQFGKT